MVSTPLHPSLLRHVLTGVTNSLPEHRIPLEVLERILRYAILPQSDVKPTSSPPHQRRSFLLISRAIYNLALPLLYHTVWITRPEQYVDLFDPVSGIFIAGKDEPARWKRVCQLAIRPPAVPPSSPASAKASASKLLPLQVPTGHTLERLCFLEPSEVCEDQRSTTDPELPRARMKHRARPQPARPPFKASREVHIERRWFLSQLLGHTRPRELHISGGALMCQDFASPGRVFNGAQVIVYASNLSLSPGNGFYRAFVVQSTLGAGPVRMVGFGRSAQQRTSFAGRARGTAGS